MEKNREEEKAKSRNIFKRAKRTIKGGVETIQRRHHRAVDGLNGHRNDYEQMTRKQRQKEEKKQRKAQVRDQKKQEKTKAKEEKNKQRLQVKEEKQAQRDARKQSGAARAR